MSNNLIETFTASQARIVTEAKADEKGSKHWYLEGIMAQAETKNLNGRIYPRAEMKRAIEELNQRAQDFTVWGELDHPDTLQINLPNVSHMIEKMWMDGNNGMGRLKIINTPMGQIAQAMLEAGGKIGCSTRGGGEVDYNGVVSDFSLVSVDLVAQPSCESAKPVILHETFNGNRAAIREDLIKAVQHDPKAQKYLHQELLSWLDSI